MLEGATMEGMDPRIAQAVRLLDTAHDLEQIAARMQVDRAAPHLQRAAALRNQSRQLVIKARGSW